MMLSVQQLVHLPLLPVLLALLHTWSFGDHVASEHSNAGAADILRMSAFHIVSARQGSRRWSTQDFWDASASLEGSASAA